MYDSEHIYYCSSYDSKQKALEKEAQRIFFSNHVTIPSARKFAGLISQRVAKEIPAGPVKAAWQYATILLYTTLELI
jgi:hypothetical protein